MSYGSVPDGEIVGGRFGLEAPIASDDRPMPFALNGRRTLFVNGTSAIAAIVRLLRPRCVWLPSYLCVALSIAVQHGGSAARFYPVSYDLDPHPRTWLDDVHTGDVVVAIDYFGFPADEAFVRAAQARGATVVEDATQALLSDGAGTRADFAVFSPRKFLGVPDGGILIDNRRLEAIDIPLAPPPEDWWLKAFGASMLRRQFDLYGGDRSWFELSREVEASAPVGDFRMSELSRMLLLNCIDYGAIQSSRRANYVTLAAELSDVALFRDLPSGVVPLGFPIRVKERDRIRERLFGQRIYPPVHWALGDLVPEKFAESHRLSAEIMTLPCDQRYGEHDMERVARAVRAAVAARP